MAELTPFVDMVDLHGRVRDPVTGNPLGEGQEGPGSIFHVPHSDQHGEYQLYNADGGTTNFSERMKLLRDAGFQGGNMTLHITPRPRDIDRVPSPPPSQSSEDEMCYGSFYRTTCVYCWAVVRGKEREAGFRLSEIQQAASNGCSTCGVLAMGIAAFAGLIFSRYSSKNVRIRQEDSGKTRLLSDTKNVSACFDEYGQEVVKLTFNLSKSSNAGASVLQTREALRKGSRSAILDNRILDTSSYATVLLVKDWMRACSEEHPLCAIPTVSALPARVLDVSNHRAKVVETQGRVAPYLTLSHCWGRKPVLRLVKDNLDAMKRDVPWTDLAKTFQDAIIFTWRLGFRYLWIDSLCIVQDSIEDWEFHASRMAQIYSDSQLTISASRAADGARGLFSARLQEPYILRSIDAQPIQHPQLWYPKELEGKDRDGCMKKFEVRLQPPHGLYQRQRAREPLLKRAWVFQEQILSSRIVHFASGEIYFECISHLTCECSGWSLRSRSHQWETRWRKAHTVLLGHETMVPDSYFTPATRKKIFDLEAYRSLVETYTELDITVDLDRLPALSGITFGRKDDYLAGMWRSILVESLHWYPVSKSLRDVLARRPSAYRAPTWSWASIEAPILHAVKDLYKTVNSPICVARIIDASVTPVGLDPRGRVSDGYLRIQGPLIEAQVTEIGICEREGSQGEEFERMAAELRPKDVDRSLSHRDKLTRDLVTYATLRSDNLEGRCYLDVPLALCRSEPAEVVVGEWLLCIMISSRMTMVLKPVYETPEMMPSFTRVGLFEPKTEGWKFSVMDKNASIVIK